MTGYGAARAEGEGVALDVQLRGINARYLDCVFRLPRAYNSLESLLRTKISEQVSRGKVEITVNRTVTTTNDSAVKLNKDKFESYLKIYKELLTEFGTGGSPAVLDKVIPDILKNSDVWDKNGGIVEDVQTIPEKELKLIESCLQEALTAFIVSRSGEGEVLMKEILRRLSVIDATVREVQKHAPSVEQIRERLIQKVSGYKGSVTFDENRIAQEIVLFADKGDISEEIARFQAHYAQMNQSIAPGNGKKLEFLLQEMLRECNTIASKSVSASINSLMVTAKVELEKIREQLQNVE